MTTTSGNHRPPLAGIRVLDLTRLLPGPMCTLHLADLGADVTKIEDTGAGDYAPDTMRAVLHRNKRAIRIDLKQPAGVEALRVLAREADVLIESFRPGVMDRLGVGFECLHALNPRLVYVSITGYGQDGPLHDQAGHDLNYASLNGAASQTGTRSGELALSNVPMADLMGGALTAAMGTLAALVDVQRSGAGRHVDIAMADALLAHMVMPLSTRAAEGRVRPAGADTLTGALPCYGYYRTADGRQLAVGALERKFWERFCEVLGRDDLKAHHRTADPALSASVRTQVSEAVAARTLAEWQARLAGVDCCVTPVLDFEEALAHPHFMARGMVHAEDHAVYGRVDHLACPVKMNGFVFHVARSAPLPGEHTDELLREAGLDDARIASLRDGGAVA